MIEFNTVSDEEVLVDVEHKNLFAPLTGFAVRGISTTGTKGMLIFIPTEQYDTLRDLIKVVE